MSDNVVANPGSGGATFRTLSDGTDQWPASVPAWVTGGSSGGWTLQYATSSNGLPVAVLNSTLAVTQSGTWNINNVSGTISLPTGAATAAKQPALGTAGSASADVITVQGITSMVALKVDGSAVTQPVSISGSVAVTQSGTWNLNNISGTISLPTGAATAAKQPALGTAGSASVDVITVQGIASMTALKVDGSAVTQPVSIAATVGTNVAQVGGTNAVTAGVNGTLAVGGNVATNVAIGTNPINLGAQAVSSENAAVTATRMAQLVTDLVGKLIVLPYANPENFVSGAITSAMTGTTSTSLVAAPGSGLRNYITQITVSNSHATVGTNMLVQDGNGGTTLYTIPAAAVYGGATITFPVPLRQPTTNTAIYIQNETTGASTKASATGYKGA